MKYLKSILTTTLIAMVLNTTYVVAQEVNNNTEQTPQKLDTKALDSKITSLEAQIKELENKNILIQKSMNLLCKFEGYELKYRLLYILIILRFAQKQPQRPLRPIVHFIVDVF